MSNYLVAHKEFIPEDKRHVLAGAFQTGESVKALTSPTLLPLHALESTQEEAYTQLILHATHMSQSYPQ